MLLYVRTHCVFILGGAEHAPSVRIEITNAWDWEAKEFMDHGPKKYSPNPTLIEMHPAVHSVPPSICCEEIASLRVPVGEYLSRNVPCADGSSIRQMSSVGLAMPDGTKQRIEYVTEAGIMARRIKDMPEMQPYIPYDCDRHGNMWHWLNTKSQSWVSSRVRLIEREKARTGTPIMLIDEQLAPAFDNA